MKCLDLTLDSPAAKERLEERRFSLEPWVNDNTRLVKPDVLPINVMKDVN